MTSDDVAELVRKQIAERWGTGNAHGVVLHQCLVPPMRISVEEMEPAPSGAAVAKVVEVWVVLEERPETRNGYKIVYDEAVGCFGLAFSRLPAGSIPYYLGPYGDFMAALEAM